MAKQIFFFLILLLIAGCSTTHPWATNIHEIENTTSSVDTHKIVYIIPHMKPYGISLLKDSSCIELDESTFMQLTHQPNITGEYIYLIRSLSPLDENEFVNFSIFLSPKECTVMPEIMIRRYRVKRDPIVIRSSQKITQSIPYVNVFPNDIYYSYDFSFISYHYYEIYFYWHDLLYY